MLNRIYINWGRCKEDGDLIFEGKSKKLEDYIKKSDYISWVKPVGDNRNWHIKVKDIITYPERMNNFISYVLANIPDVSIFERKLWGEQWKEILLERN